MKRQTIIALSFIFLSTPAVDAGAQLADPSARSFGLSGAYTARARGYESVFWNPANLGLSDRPGWSIGLPAVNAFVANNSLTYGQISSLYGEFLDDATKSDLLAGIRRGDPERMLKLNGDIGAHWLGFSIGRFAIAGGTIGTGTAQLSSDAVELLLFGNVGEDGQGKDFALEGSNALGWGVSAVGVSYGHPLPIPVLEQLGMEVSAGATVKYLVAHGLGRVLDQGSLFSEDPLAVDITAEAIYSNDVMSGNGWSVDLAAAMKWEAWTAGLTIKNAIGNIGWDEEVFELAVVSVSADFDESTSTDTTFSFAELTLEDQERVREFLSDASLPTRVRLGGKYEVSSKFNVSGDFEELVGGGLRAGWERQFAAGAELNALAFLPLRIGVGTNFEDVAYSGGLGVYAGPVHFDIALRRQGIPGGDGLAGAFSISVWPGMKN